MTDLAVHALLALVVVQALVLCLTFAIAMVNAVGVKSIGERLDRLMQKLEDRYGFDMDEDEYTPY